MGSKNLLNTSVVANFYRDKTIFLTGGTGFLGTAMILKILSSCDGIKNIYMLTKPKYGKSVQERVENMLNMPVFDSLKKQNSDQLKKVKPINGDLLEEDLGLNESDIKTLQNEVQIVFHLAANLNFNMALADAININTRATRRLVKLLKGMQKLCAFVYVSTAFTHSNRQLIDEKHYETGCSLEALDYVVEELKNHPLQDIMKEGRPNTYTVSKALAEGFITTEFTEAPVAIVRPSIIMGALKEPEPGWVHGWSGVNHIITGLGKGTIRCWNAEVDSACDVVPVDMVVNLVIVAAWDVFRRRSGTGINEVKFFNCSSVLQNPITNRKIFQSSAVYGRKHFKKEGFMFPILFLVKSPVLNAILHFLLETIPAYILHLVERLYMLKFRSLYLHRKITQMKSAIEVFTLGQIILIDYNVRRLFLDLNDKDRQIFDFNIKTVEWDSFIENAVLGIKKYLLKET